MRTTAKVDYAVRAALELARAHPADGSRPVPVTRHRIAEAQAIPSKFLEHILADLRRGGLVASVRGTDGGYWLQRPPENVSMADIIRAVEGPLADVRGERPETLDYPDDLAAALETRFDAAITPGDVVATVRHAITHRRITLHAHAATARRSGRLKWFRLGDETPWTTPSRKVFRGARGLEA